MIQLSNWEIEFFLPSSFEPAKSYFRRRRPQRGTLVFNLLLQIGFRCLWIVYASSFVGPSFGPTLSALLSVASCLAKRICLIWGDARGVENGGAGNGTSKAKVAEIVGRTWTEFEKAKVSVFQIGKASVVRATGRVGN